MPAKVRIPAPLRKLTKEQAVVDVAGKTVDEILVNLEKNYPGMKERICDENGQIRRFINVFVNGEDIRFKEKWWAATVLKSRVGLHHIRYDGITPDAEEWVGLRRIRLRK